VPKKTIRDLVIPESTHLGRELGRLCVLHGYTVLEIAGVFGVSRQTAYNWVLGRTYPSRYIRERVAQLVVKLKRKPIPIPLDENE